MRPADWAVTCHGANSKLMCPRPLKAHDPDRSTMMHEMIAKVFVHSTDFDSPDRLFEAVRTETGLTPDDRSNGRLGRLQLEVLNNPDRNLIERVEGDFLYFPYIIELHGEPSFGADEIASTAEICRALQSLGTTYVVAADFEEALGAASRNDEAK